MPERQRRELAQQIHHTLAVRNPQQIDSISEHDLHELINAVAEGVQTALDNLSDELRGEMRTIAAHEIQVQERRQARRR